MKKTLLSFVLLFTITACNSHNTKPQQEPIAGMANPASVYCVDKGGKLNIIKEKEGEIGICQLPNGEQIEEWALYRRDHP